MAAVAYTGRRARRVASGCVAIARSYVVGALEDDRSLERFRRPFEAALATIDAR